MFLRRNASQGTRRVRASVAVLLGRRIEQAKCLFLRPGRVIRILAVQKRFEFVFESAIPEAVRVPKLLQRPSRL